MGIYVRFNGHELGPITPEQREAIIEQITSIPPEKHGACFPLKENGREVFCIWSVGCPISFYEK